MYNRKAYIFLLVILLIFISITIGIYMLYLIGSGRFSERQTTFIEGVSLNDEQEKTSWSSGGSSGTVGKDEEKRKEKEEEKKEKESKGITSKSGNVTVSKPKEGDVLGATFDVSGLANVFENTVRIRVTDARGNMLLETFATVDLSNTGKTGPFETKVELDKFPATTAGTIKVYTVSMKDGSEEDIVEVQIKFDIK